MTMIIKEKEVNGNYVTISQEKFSESYKVELTDRFGRTDRKNNYCSLDKAKKCFYNYCKEAKRF